MPLSDERLEELLRAPGAEKALDKLLAEDDLMEFMRQAWPFVDPAPFMENWHHGAIAEHLTAVSMGQIRKLLINIAPRHGKPISINDLVLSRRGRIRLGDVVIGDEVLTHKGRYRRVEEIHEQGLLPTLTIRTYAGRESHPALDHPFLTPKGWVQAKDLRVRDTLAAVVPLQDDNVDKITPEEARLLGYLVGDGGVTHSPIFTNADHEVLADFERCAATVGIGTARRARCPSEWRRDAKALNIGLRGALGWLEKHGLLGKNSYTKRIPVAVFASSKNIIANFLGAYLSCDGCIQVKHRNDGVRTIMVADASTVSLDLAHDVQHALLRIGIDSRIRTQTVSLKTKRQGDTYTSYRVTTSSNEEVAKFATIPGLCSRKASLAAQLILQRFVQGPLVEDEIIEIADGGLRECRCLTVEEDHSFTVEDIAVHNTILVNTIWPAWIWAHKRDLKYPLLGPQVKFLCLTYNMQVTFDNATTARRVIGSEWYQRNWGDLFQIKSDQDAKQKFDTTAGGTRISASFGGSVLGRGGDIKIIDDPIKPDEVASDIVREGVLREYDETLASRVTDPRHSAEVIVMQRLHEQDLSGHVIEKGEHVHLCIPESYEPGRHCVTVIGWEDPRTEDGELMWPGRFGPEELRVYREQPYVWAGQFQQAPTPRGGGIIKREWWRNWPPDDWPDQEMAKVRFPPFEYVCAALDTAYTEKKENDPSALVVMGIWRGTASGNTMRITRDANGEPVLGDDRHPKIMMIYAWAKRLTLHGPPESDDLRIAARYCEKCRALPGADHDVRCSELQKLRQENWGLVEWTVKTCRDYKISTLLVEDKAAGHSVAQELSRLYGAEDWAVNLVNPKGDKVARVYAVSHLFSNGQVYAPLDRAWCDEAVTEISTFPRGRHDDRMDAAAMCLQHLRETGLALRSDEADRQWNEEISAPRRTRALYDV